MSVPTVDDLLPLLLLWLELLKHLFWNDGVKRGQLRVHLKVRVVVMAVCFLVAGVRGGPRCAGKVIEAFVRIAGTIQTSATGTVRRGSSLVPSSHCSGKKFVTKNHTFQLIIDTNGGY